MKGKRKFLANYAFFLSIRKTRQNRNFKKLVDFNTLFLFFSGFLRLFYLEFLLIIVLEIYNYSFMKSILIVEDEIIIALDLKNILAENGYEVVGIVSKGEDAVKAALEKKPSIIIMDINLRDGLTGVKAAKRIVEGIESKIIFQTAYTDMYDDTFSISPYLLKKPFSKVQLLNCIEEIFDADAA